MEVGVPQGTLAGPLFWLAFINSYEPPMTGNIKYADDITCFRPIGNSCDSSILDTIRWGLEWCKTHSMTLNTDKTKAMLLCLSQRTRVPTLFSPVELVSNYKLLGIIIDSNLTFNTHISYVVNKAQRRFYGLVQLKRLGVAREKLSMFYIANVRSVLVYCISAFYSLLSTRQLDSLERTQKLCTKIILPDIGSYTERLEILSLSTIRDFGLNLYRNKFLHIYATDHRLHKLIPERQSTNRRHSTRTKDTFITRSHTSLRPKSFFYYGANNFL